MILLKHFEIIPNSSLKVLGYFCGMLCITSLCDMFYYYEFIGETDLLKQREYFYSSEYFSILTN